MRITQQQVEGDHVVLTGPITGTVELSDGTVVDVSPVAVAADDELHAAEIAHAIGQHWSREENIHPAQRDDAGKVVEDFVYDDSHYRETVKRLKRQSKQDKD